MIAWYLRTKSCPSWLSSGCLKCVTLSYESWWGHLCGLCILNFIARHTHPKVLSLFCFICSGRADTLYKSTPQSLYTHSITLALKPPQPRLLATFILFHKCGFSHWNIYAHSLKWCSLLSALCSVSAQVYGISPLRNASIFLSLVNPTRKVVFHKSGTILRYVSSHSKT